MRLNNCQIHENRCNKKHTLLRGVNKNMPVISTVFVRINLVRSLKTNSPATLPAHLSATLSIRWLDYSTRDDKLFGRVTMLFVE